MDNNLISICICTYKRPQIVETLASVRNIEIYKGYKIEIIVVDNDELPSAKNLVTSYAKNLPFPLNYIHAPDGNISIARNACLENARGAYVAFIDDDETASNEWLHELFEVLISDNSDVVLGPVKAVYNEDAPEWMKKGDFHSTYPVFVGEEIITGYSCNVLINCKSEKFANLRFDLSRGKSGGEDTEFFNNMWRLGAKISYAPKAWVFEIVPFNRANFTWLKKRRFRFGQTHGRQLRENNKAYKIPILLGVTLLKVAYCYSMASICIINEIKWRKNYLRGLLHIGTINGLIGKKEIELY